MFLEVESEQFLKVWNIKNTLLQPKCSSWHDFDLICGNAGDTGVFLLYCWRLHCCIFLSYPCPSAAFSSSVVALVESLAFDTGSCRWRPRLTEAECCARHRQAGIHSADRDQLSWLCGISQADTKIMVQKKWQKHWVDHFKMRQYYSLLYKDQEILFNIL